MVFTCMYACVYYVYAYRIVDSNREVSFADNFDLIIDAAEYERTKVYICFIALLLNIHIHIYMYIGSC